MRLNNNCNFRGRLVRDPKVREVSGKTVAEFSIAVKAFRKDDEPEYIDCEAWGQQADYVQQYLKQGDMVHVGSWVKTQKWNDKTTGEKRSRKTYMIDAIDGIGSKGGGNPDEAEQGGEPEAPKAKAKAKAKPAVEEPEDFEEDEDMKF